MANYNFKRGIDHGASTDDPNTYFVYSGRWINGVFDGGGSDLGTGSSSDQWKSLTHAYANTSSGDTIVAFGEFIDQVGSVGTGWTDRNFLGDGLNGDTIIRNSGNDRVAFNSINTTVENFVIINYDKSFSLSGVFSSSLSVTGTYIKDCNGTDIDDGLYINSIFINTDVTIKANCSLDNCMSYNSNIINNTGNPSNQALYSRCYFDENSNYIASTGLGTVRITNICHVDDLTTFDSGDPTGLDLQVSTIDEVGSPAQFVSPSYFDRAVEFTSPLIKLDASGNIGNTYRGFSFSPDQPDFEAIVMANPDIDLVGGELVLVPSVPLGESRPIEGFEVIASGLNTLSVALQIGISYKSEYVFQVRWSGNEFSLASPEWMPSTFFSAGDRVQETSPSTGIDCAYIRIADGTSGLTFDLSEESLWICSENISWKSFRMGENMTQNIDGTTTGEDGFDWGDINPIVYKVAQGRLVLTQIP